MARRYNYPGSCHCGAIAVRFESAKTARELGTRTDTCSFCARHRSVYTSDPDGELAIALREPELVQRYRFGTKTADFLICRACGVFVAACMDELAVLNVAVLDARADFLATELQIADLDGESLADRLARRRRRWTPLRVE